MVGGEASRASVVVVDYGAGNLRSVEKALASLGHAPLVTSDPAAVAAARALVLPGVGAAADTMRGLESLGLTDAVRAYVRGGRPFLGVCMGLQALLTGSEEGGWQPCLDLVPGRVTRFVAEPSAPKSGASASSSVAALKGGPIGGPSGPPFRAANVENHSGQNPSAKDEREPLAPRALKIPHMGWNTVRQVRPHPFFSGIPDGAYFYFVHSYYVVPSAAAVIAGTTDYGVTFPSVLIQDNVIGTQFHPEKSGDLGLRLYDNFVRLCARAAVG